MKSWIEPEKINAPTHLAEAIGGPPLLAEVLTRRGWSDPAAARAFLDPAHYQPAPPEALPGLERAYARIRAALDGKQTILVWGDFDVDGQTATALLVQALRELGGQVAYHLPIRAHESHGISPLVLERLLARFEPGLVLTCDTGIAAFEAAQLLESASVDLVITDHHALPNSQNMLKDMVPAAQLPKAAAIVTPRFLPDDHPLAALPGVGVAYKLVEALYADTGRPVEAEKYQDLAALGIVADVALQVADTRWLLQRGLERLRHPSRPGLDALYQAAGVDPTRMTEEHIGFTIAPRLNALGRLADSNPVVELLSAGSNASRTRLESLALEIERLNARRKLLTSQIMGAALAQLEAEPELLQTPIPVLAGAGWHSGIIGIVAGRLVELYGKPVVLVALPAPGEAGPGRGSARSIQGLDITAALAANAGLLIGYGGHAMAAGFSILPENVSALQRNLHRIQAGATPGAGAGIEIDAYLRWDALSLDLAAAVERLAPFGPGNPPPALATPRLRLVSHAALGKDRAHLTLTFEDENGLARRVVWWGGSDLASRAGLPEIAPSKKVLSEQTGESDFEPGSLTHPLFDLAYSLRAITFQGRHELQLQLLDLRPVVETAPEISAPRLEIQDYRNLAHPLPIIHRLLAEEVDIQVWAEATPAFGFNISSHSRYTLVPCRTLVIWTSPPSRQALQTALAQTRPQKVVLFGVDPGYDQLRAFLERLGGLVKRTLADPSFEGKESLDRRLAVALAARESAIRLGLEWLETRGHIEISTGEKMTIQRPSRDYKPDPLQATVVLEKLRIVLDETRAYREFFYKTGEPLDLVTTG